MKHYDRATLESRLAETEASLDAATAKAIRRAFDEFAPAELASVNARSFARRYGLEGEKILVSFLRLTKVGVFDLLWIVHCPHCKGPTQMSHALGELHGDASCALCEADFRAGFDTNVHLAFRASAAIVDLSSVDPMAVALAGQEVEAGVAFVLEAGARRSLDHPLVEGNYRLADLDRGLALGIEVSKELPTGRSEYLWRLAAATDGPLMHRSGPGRIKLLLHNDTGGDRELHFARLREAEWPDAVSVSNIPEFRDFFAEERISPNESFQVGRLALLFTDIKGSTAMYERLGDAAAFDIVRAHFAIMEELVASHEGRLVKTIGDAVMAAFPRGRDAVAAARDMIDAFDRFNAEGKAKDDVIVKIGAHSGSCIAVTLNDRLDYFGGAVNIAARIQGLSDGRDFMLSRELRDEAGVAEEIPKEGWDEEEFSIGLKGIEGERRVVKLAKLTPSS